MNKGKFLALAGLMALSTLNWSDCSNKAPVTMAVINAKVWTGDSAKPLAEAIAISGERIVAIGKTAAICKMVDGQTTVVDAGGHLITPGFYDAHLHLIEGGFRLTSVQLRAASSKSEFVNRIQKYAAQCEPGTWIVGGDWDHSLWGGELPTRQWIDAVTPDNPVWINRLDGHMALANSLALKAAGIDRNTPNVDGGTIVRDKSGNPTGIFKDNAMYQIEKAIPEPTDRMKDQALTAAMKYVAAQGVTSVHHMGTWDDLAVFTRASRAGNLQTRIYAAVPIYTWERLSEKIKADGSGDEWLHWGLLKGFVDGSLGSHTAAFSEPFSDTQQDSGLLVNSPEELYTILHSADSAGMQIAIHAIGDRANRIMLDIYEKIVRDNGPRDRRDRIEHVQHLKPTDIPRFGALNIIASMQPYHAIDDGRWAEEVIGHERCESSYAWRSLLDSGARLAFGSDWYVAPPTPLEGIYAAVTRRTLDDKNPDGWIPAQKISVEEALRAYTIDAAYAGFEESERGSLTEGKLADFVMLDRDLLTIPAAELRSTQVLMTVVGGQVVYERNPE